MGATTPSIITPEFIAAVWRLNPQAAAWPGRTAGLSAAVFGQAGSRDLDLPSPRDPATHVLSVELAPCRLLFEVDGRLVADRLVMPGEVQVVRAGEAPRARVSGNWRIIQFYVPAADLRQLAADLGVPWGAARELELLDPAFTPDPVLARMGRRLDRRLARGDHPGRLELDELALRLGGRLVRRHSSAPPPRRQRAGLSDAERRLAAAFLADAGDPGLGELAVLLGRPAAELPRACAGALGAFPSAARRRLRGTRPR